MKPLLFLLLLLLICTLPPVLGQDDNTACCTKITADGRALYDAGEYALAKAKFELAKSACACPGMDAWIAKCDAALRGPRTYTETVNGVSFTMVAIPGGTFSMGSNHGDSDEKPVHTVTIHNFYLGETEVTQALWRAVMGTNPSNFNNCDKCPVENVSWDDAQAFIKKLNSLTGPSRTSGTGGYRLPTEAEWEYAAGGGASTAASTRPKWAGTSSENSLGNYAWYGSNYKTNPVKTKSPNALGLYDMSGNVWEWCQDWYDEMYYQNSSSYNPLNSTSATYHILRGGSWTSISYNCRITGRNRSLPTNRFDYNGFRLAR